MLSIGTGPRIDSSGDVREQLRRDLVACHANIRRFSQTAVALAARGSHPSEIVDAASGLVAYFGDSLRHHIADEEVSLAPRLLALPPDETLARAISRMSAEHLPLDELVAEALPLWQRLAVTPAVLPDLRSRLLGISQGLWDAFAAHLHGEETEVFPALCKLSVDEVLGIRREMKQRRARP